jgi:hypothetical protein
VRKAFRKVGPRTAAVLASAIFIALSVGPAG